MDRIYYIEAKSRYLHVSADTGPFVCYESTNFSVFETRSNQTTFCVLISSFSDAAAFLVSSSPSLLVLTSASLLGEVSSSVPASNFVHDDHFFASSASAFSSWSSHPDHIPDAYQDS